ncbi:MAG: hypothetical protein RLZZ156_2659 [Deinococcota bacterium]|jgi:hypothetical protein
MINPEKGILLGNMKMGEITKPLIELMDDAFHAEKYLDTHNEPFFRRIYIRSVISDIEAVVWFLKQLCIKVSHIKPQLLDPSEYGFLSDETYELKENGDIQKKSKFLRLESNIQFTIKICNRLFHTSVDLQTGTIEWQSFLKTIKVRNRITHPKNAIDLQISDDELETCKRTSSWFNQKIYDFVNTLRENSKISK